MYTKFSDLTSGCDRCGCKPTKEEVKRCFLLEFDRAAFIIVQLREEEMLCWYREHVVWADETLNLKLLKKGIMTRIYAPMPTPAFIFPMNNQQAAAVVAMAGNRSGPVKSASAIVSVVSSIAANSVSGSSSSTAAVTAPTVSFNYQNLPLDEAQYLAILQNNGQQQQQQQQQPLQSHVQPQQGHPNTSTSSGSSLSQKHQQLQSGGGDGGVGNSHRFSVSKNVHQQQQQPS